MLGVGVVGIGLTVVFPPIEKLNTYTNRMETPTAGMYADARIALAGCALVGGFLMAVGRSRKSRSGAREANDKASASDEARASEEDLNGLTWIANAAAADGKVSMEERVLLDGAAERMNIAGLRVEELIESALREEHETPAPPDHKTGIQWLEALADVALADGYVRSSERRMLEQLGDQLPEDPNIDRILDRRRVALRDSMN